MFTCGISFYTFKDIGRAFLKSLMEEGKYETAARFAKIFFVITCPCFDEALLPADNCETFLLEILSVQIVHQSIK